MMLFLDGCCTINLAKFIGFLTGNTYICVNCGTNCNGYGKAITWRYEGELDKEERMCGFGALKYQATNPDFTGTAN